MKNHRGRNRKDATLVEVTELSENPSIWTPVLLFQACRADQMALDKAATEEGGREPIQNSLSFSRHAALGSGTSLV